MKNLASDCKQCFSIDLLHLSINDYFFFVCILVFFCIVKFVGFCVAKGVYKAEPHICEVRIVTLYRLKFLLTANSRIVG